MYEKFYHEILINNKIFVSSPVSAFKSYKHNSTCNTDKDQPWQMDGNPGPGTGSGLRPPQHAVGRGGNFNTSLRELELGRTPGQVSDKSRIK